MDNSIEILKSGVCRMSISGQHEYECHERYFWCRICGNLVELSSHKKRFLKLAIQHIAQSPTVTMLSRAKKIFFR